MADVGPSGVLSAGTLQTLTCIYCRAVIAMTNGTARYKQHLSELFPDKVLSKVGTVGSRVESTKVKSNFLTHFLLLNESENVLT